MLVEKRNKKIEKFDINRVKNAIKKAMLSCKSVDIKIINVIALKIENFVKKNNLPTNVETIQDLIENLLIKEDFINVAKSYILYRNERTKMRKFFNKNSMIEFKKLIKKNKKYFPNDLAEFIYFRTYSRWLDNKNRREVWEETVNRYINFMKSKLQNYLTKKEYNEIKNYILYQKVMPSMRLLQFAGKAAEKTNVCCYNCAYTSISNLKDFSEIMYICMCGAGVGFSVENKNIINLPFIKKRVDCTPKTYTIADSKEGWCKSLLFGLRIWFNGYDIKFNYKKIRPCGSRLKTIGGRSSGPEPLIELHNFVKNLIFNNQLKQLKSVDIYDIVCKIGEIVITGGVRRTAMISLSDINDESMINAKSGVFYIKNPQRCVCNNSTAYNNIPTDIELINEWKNLITGSSGERGIFNRINIKDNIPIRRLENFNKNNIDLLSLGLNPCGEIILQNKQFCNLTEIICRSDDTFKTILRKAKIATIIGTFQATLTKFPFLSKEWENNCKSESLLGVSLTGIWDCKKIWNIKNLKKLKEFIIKINKKFSNKFKINSSTATTCIKPSGTVSQLLNCSSGIHQRFSKYYIRRVRISSTDPIFRMLKNDGIKYFAEVGQNENNASTYVLEFPIKSPSKSFTNEISAIKQLNMWKKFKINYTEHNPSVTIYVKDDEWINVLNWINNNWKIIGGLSFLPKTNHIYKLAPYEKISYKNYKKMIKSIINIDYSKLLFYERNDLTEQIKEFACSGNNCEL